MNFIELHDSNNSQRLINFEHVLIIEGRGPRQSVVRLIGGQEILLNASYENIVKALTEPEPKKRKKMDS